MILVRIQHSDKCNLFHLIAANICYHQWMCAITFLKVLFSQPAFHAVALLQLVETWQPHFEIFTFWFCSYDFYCIQLLWSVLIFCKKKIFIIDSHEKCEYVMISVKPACRVSICGKNFNVAIFSDAMNMINVKLCITVVLIALYPFIPLSMTLTAFQS